MAKGTGIYGNFNGKIGNTVGFKIAQSRNRQNQGVRIYQPSVGNPKTAAQAEQRARVAAVQGTYTMLRNIIDRGNERKPYGYASRVEWLRQAYRSEIFPWYPKGARIAAPVICPLTFGTLLNVDFYVTEDGLFINCPSVGQGEIIGDVSALSQSLLDSYPFLREGDQITLISMGSDGTSMFTEIVSYIIDINCTDEIKNIGGGAGNINWQPNSYVGIFSVIISREGPNGQHIRSSSSLKIPDDLIDNAPYNAASKAAAIASYQNAGAANNDWSEDPDI